MEIFVKIVAPLTNPGYESFCYVCMCVCLLDSRVNIFMYVFFNLLYGVLQIANSGDPLPYYPLKKNKKYENRYLKVVIHL